MQRAAGGPEELLRPFDRCELCAGDIIHMVGSEKQKRKPESDPRFASNKCAYVVDLEYSEEDAAAATGVGGAACTPKALRRLIEMLGVYTSPHPGSVSTGKLWLHGFSAREPHFRQKLVKALKDHAKGLADGEFLLEQSHSLVGVADERHGTGR